MAGKTVKCRKAGCGQTFTVSAAQNRGAPIVAEVVPQWYLTVGDKQVGPMPKSDLDRYANSPNASPAAYVMSTAHQQWQPIGTFYPHLAQVAAYMPPAVAYLANLQAQHQQYQAHLAQEEARRPQQAAPNPYAAPMHYSSQRSRSYSGGGMPGVLIAMCIVVFVVGTLRIVHSIYSYSQLAGIEKVIKQLRNEPGTRINPGVEGRIAGQKFGIVFGAILATGEISGAILLLLRKRAGKSILKGFSWVTIVLGMLGVVLIVIGLILGGAAMASGNIPGFAGAAMAIVIVALLIGFALIAAYYWFIFYTLGRDDVEAALE